MSPRPLDAAERTRLVEGALELRRSAESRREGTLGQGAADLEILQTLLAQGEVSLERPAELRALATLFGEVLIHELGLEWVEVEDEMGREAALRLPSSTVLFFPQRMLANEHQTSSGLDLKWLYASTRDYLRQLRRFVPSLTNSPPRGKTPG